RVRAECKQADELHTRGHAGCDQLTVVPKSRPMSADAPIASAPQNATRKAPRVNDAPPTCAASAPSPTRSTSVVPITACVRYGDGTNADTRTGKAAPA